MTNYSELSQHPSRFLALTGYTVEEFEALLPHFQTEFESYVQTYTLDGGKRAKRKYSTYKNSPLLTIEDRLLFILVYLKQAATQELHGTLFGMSQPRANGWIHLLHPLLNRALTAAGELPVRDAAQLHLSEEAHTLFFHDGTERPIHRPKDSQDQRTHYSGKKKQHTVKMYLVGTVYNFCTYHGSLRIPVYLPRGRRRWLRRTPAIAADITDHLWTVEELLSLRVPPPRWRPPTW